MTIDKYPITRLNVLPRSFINSGYQIWYWFVGMSALTCPIEPLTPEFWQRTQKSILVYGIVLSAIDKQDGGDLLILVSQNLKDAQKEGLRKLSMQQRQDLYNLVFHLDFLQVTGFHSVPVWTRISFFQRFEKAFDLHILPRRDEKGGYHRELMISHEDHLLQPDSDGKFSCPKCGHLVEIGKGLTVLDNFYDDDGRIFMVSVCEYCEEFVKLRIDAPPSIYFHHSIYFPKMASSSNSSRIAQ
jgi:hypothetical protein